jgi:hypothetical protein
MASQDNPNNRANLTKSRFLADNLHKLLSKQKIELRLF